MSIKRFEETIFYKYWTDRINTEQSFIESYDSKASIGDIINIKKRKKNIEQMLEIIKMRHDRWVPGENIDLNVGNRYTINYTTTNNIVAKKKERDYCSDKYIYYFHFIYF